MPIIRRMDGEMAVYSYSGIAVQLLSRVQFFATPWATACQAPLSSTVSQSLLKFMCIESVMPSNGLILCCPLLLLPSIFPSISVFSNKSALHIRWPKNWNLIILICIFFKDIREFLIQKELDLKTKRVENGLLLSSLTYQF